MINIKLTVLAPALVFLLSGCFTSFTGITKVDKDEYYITTKAEGGNTSGGVESLFFGTRYSSSVVFDTAVLRCKSQQNGDLECSRGPR